MMSRALCVNLLVFVPLLKEAQNIINQVCAQRQTVIFMAFPDTSVTILLRRCKQRKTQATVVGVGYPYNI